MIVGGEISESWSRRYHCFDMHAFRDLSSQGHGRIAADTILTHRNTVREMGGALGVGIPAIPRQICLFHHNWFAAEKVEQLEARCNIWA